MKTWLSRLSLLGIVLWMLLALPSAPLAASSDPLTEEFQTCPFHTRMAAPENVMIAPGPRADEVTVYWQPLRPEQMGLGDLGQLTSVSVFVERRQSHGKVRELHKRHLPLGISMVTISDIPQPQSVEVTVGLTRQNYLISDTAQERFGRALRIQSLPPVTGFRAKIEIPEDPAQASGIPQGAFVQVSAQSQTADENLRGEPDERNVRLLWDAPSSKVGLAGFRIERCASTTDCDSPLATYNLGPNFTEHTVLGLTRDTTYYFRITSLAIPGDEYEDSPPSAILAVRTLKTTLATVTGFSAQPDAHDSVDLAWTKLASQDGLAGFRIDRCASATDCDTPQQMYNVGPSVTTLTVTGLQGATSYYFRITAEAVADSGYQNGDPTTIVTVTTEKTPLATVLNFQATSTEAKSITLGWAAPVSQTGLKDFRIAQCPSSNSCTSPTKTWDRPKSATSYKVTGLDRKTTYYFRITARANASSDYQDAAASPIITVTTGKTPLAVVKGFKVSALKDTSVTLTWNAPSSTAGLKEFQIDRCTTADCTSVSKAGTANKTTTNHTLQNLTRNTTYYYRITAVAKNGLLQNGYQNSAPSTLLTVTTAKTSLAAVTGFKQTTVTDTSVTLTWDAPASATGRSAFLIEHQCSSCTTPKWEPAAASATSHTVTGLQANVTYRFRIKAQATTNSDYVDSAQVTISVKTGTTALAKVINFEASTVKATSITLGWDAPVSQTGLKDFLIEACTSTSNCTNPDEVATPGKNKTEHEVTGLKRKTDYYYRITARATANSDYRNSAPSTIIKVTTGKTPLAVVTGFKATAITDTSVTLGWTAPTSKTKLKEFRIDRCAKADCTGTITAVATPDKDDTSHKVTQLTRNTTYHYRITAVTASRGYQNSVASTILTVTTAKTQLAKVTNFKATNTADTSVTLGWDAPSSKTNLAGFRIEQCPSASSCTGSHTDFNLAASATSHTVKGLTPNTKYYFRITARAKANTDYQDAAPTAILTVTMGKGRLAQLMNFQATTVTATGITLGWKAPTDKTNIKDFLIESCTSASDCTDPDEEATPGKDATSQALTDLERNTTYYYRITVRAKTNSEYRDAKPSGIITVTTGKTPLAVVKGLAATSVTETGLTLGWTAPTDKTNIKDFLIESCTSASDCTDPDEVATPSKNQISYTVTGLTRNTTYYYRITARATAGSNYQDSAVSTVLTVTTAKTPLAAVANFRATTTTETSITLGWQAPADKTKLTGFRIETCRSYKDCTGATTVFNLWANATSHTVKGLTANTNYYYRITALALDGSDYRHSAPSAILTVKTQKYPLATVARFRATDNTANTRVTLGWDIPSDTTDVVKFKLERCTDATCSGTPTLVAEPAKTEETRYTEIRHTIRDLTRNTTYYFRLTAIAKVDSQYRDSLPALLTVTTANHTGLDTVDKFRVTAKTATTVTLAWHPTVPQTALGSYLLTTVDGSSVRSWSLGVSTKSFTVTNLSPNTTYRFRIRAVAKLNSGHSNSGQTSVSAKTGLRLATPHNFRRGQYDATLLQLEWAWSGATTELDKFRLERCTDASCSSSTLVAEPASTARGYTVKDLTVNTTYYFRIMAIAKTGSTHENSAARVLTTETRRTPRVPPVTNFQATSTDTTITLTWDSPTNLSGIKALYVRQTYPFDINGHWSLATNATSRTVTGRSPNTNYHFEIQAVSHDSQNDSIWRKLWISTKTKLATPGLSWDRDNSDSTLVALTWTWTGSETDLDKFKLERCADASCSGTPTLVAEPAKTARGYTVKNLTANTTYYFRLTAIAKADHLVDASSSIFTVTTRSSARVSPVENFRVTARTATSITLAWDAPANLTGVTSIWLERTWPRDKPRAVALDTSVTSYTVTGRPPNTNHHFQINTLSRLGEGDSIWRKLQTTTKSRLATVTNFRATATATSVTLTWDAPASTTDLDKFKIESCTDATCSSTPTQVATPVKTATSHTVSDLTANTTYYYRITALATADSSTYAHSLPSAIFTVTTTTNPTLAAVTNFRQTAITDSSVTLAWDAPASTTGLGNFKIESCTDATCSGTPTEVATPASTATTHTVTDLTRNTTYYYRITAVASTNSNYASATPSAAITFTTAKTQLATLNVKVTTQKNSITLSWAPDSTAGISGFTLVQATDSACTSIGKSQLLSSTTTSWTHTGNVSSNTTYYYRITVNATSDYLASATTCFGATTVQYDRLPLTNFRATAISGDRVTLAWDAATPSNALSHYDFTDHEGTVHNVQTATTRGVQGLTPGTKYTFQVQAKVQTGQNYEDSLIQELAVTTLPRLPKITNFRLSSVSNASAILAWNVPTSKTNISKLQIQKCSSSDCSSVSGTSDLTGSYLDTGTYTSSTLQASTTYYFRIKAVAKSDSSYVDSEYSAVITVTTTGTSVKLPTVTNFRSTATTDTSVTLAWDTPVDTEVLSSFKIEKCTSASDCTSPTQVATPAKTATTHTVSDLTRNTTYYYRITAVAAASSGYQNSTPSAVLTVTTAKTTLATVGNFRSTATTNTSATLAWNHASLATGLEQFKVESCTSASDCTSPTQVATSPVHEGATSYTLTLTNLPSSETTSTYYYRVTAIATANSDYVDSVPSSIITVRTAGPLAKVTNFRVTTIRPNSLTLAWSYPNTTGLNQFKIESCTSASDCTSPTQVATPAKTATTHTVSDLTTHTSYYYRITAIATANTQFQNSAVSTVITGTTGGPLASVTNFKKTATTDTSITLAWDAPTSTTGLDKFKIEKCASVDDCTSPTQVATPAKTATTHTVSDLTRNTTYYYRITALTASAQFQDSAPSSILTVRTEKTHLPQVTGLKYTGTPSTVTLVWDSVGANSCREKLLLEQCSSAKDCSSSKTPYKTYDMGQNPGQYMVTGLDSRATYYFRITAKAKADNLSNSACDYQDSEPSAILTALTGGPLAQVTNFRTTTVTTTSVTLAWKFTDTASSEGLNQFKIEKCTSASDCTSPTAVATPAKTATTHTVSDLTANTTYYYRITAIANSNTKYQNSTPSTTLTVTTAKTPLTAVANLRSTATTSTSVTLAWDAPGSTTDLDKFKIESCTSASDCTSPTQVATPAKEKTTATVTGLRPNRYHYFRITALATASGNHADSAPSATVSALTDSSLDPVTKFTSTAKTDTSVTLSWEATPYDWSTIQYVIGYGNTEVTSGSKSSLGTSYTVKNLQPFTQYEFHISLKDTDDDEVGSTRATVTVTTAKTPLAAVTGFKETKTATTDTSVTLAWDAPSSKTDLRGFKLERCSDAACATVAATKNAGKDDTSLAWTTLTRNTTYYFRITAEATDSGTHINSAPSAVLTVTTAKTQLAQVAGFTGSYTSGTLTLSWTAPADKTGLANFKIEVCETAQCTTVKGESWTAGKDDTSHSHSSRTNGTYHYRITAIATAGGDYQDSVPAATTVTIQ